MRLVDSDDLLAHLPNELPYKASVRRVLMQAEEIAAAQVVRCKDCKYFDQRYVCTFHSETPTRDNDEFLVYMLPDSFCSFGERRCE